jgi:hypothetical protein
MIILNRKPEIWYNLMRGWFSIFHEVEVGRLAEILMLVKKALNRRSYPCHHYTTAPLVTNTCAHELASPRRLSFLGSPATSWCPTCPPWSTPWFLITIKLLGSHLFSRSLADEHKNKFSWRRSCCAHDLITGPCTLIEGVVVSDIVMFSSVPSVHYII